MLTLRSNTWASAAIISTGSPQRKSLDGVAMPRRPEKGRSDSFWMRSWVMVFNGLWISIIPALAVVMKHGVGWFGITCAFLFCAGCFGIWFAALAIDRRLE